MYVNNYNLVKFNSILLIKLVISLKKDININRIEDQFLSEIYNGECTHLFFNLEVTWNTSCTLLTLPYGSAAIVQNPQDRKSVV